MYIYEIITKFNQFALFPDFAMLNTFHFIRPFSIESSGIIN